jgi:hypothetical protein
MVPELRWPSLPALQADFPLRTCSVVHHIAFRVENHPGMSAALMAHGNQSCQNGPRAQLMPPDKEDLT